MRLSRYKILLAAAIIIVAGAGPATADELFFSPADTIIWNTDTFPVHVMVADIDSLMGWDISVTLTGDPCVKILGVSEGTLPGSNGDETFFYWLDQWDTGSIHVNGSVLGTVVDGPGILFTIHIKALFPLQPGEAWLDFSYSELRNGVNESLTHDSTGRARIEVMEPIAVAETSWGAIKAVYRRR